MLSSTEVLPRPLTPEIMVNGSSKEKEIGDRERKLFKESDLSRTYKGD
jgi:hypothetical protein